MNDLIIYSEEQDFAGLAQAFSDEFESDCTLSCEIVTADEEEIGECTRILERAGFSQTEISEQEFLRVIGHLTNRASHT